MKLLDNLKVVDTISFGTETSDLAALNNIANILTEEPREYSNYLKEELKKGILKEIQLSDFKMQHDFDFIWEKGSIYSGKYCEVCGELA